MAEPPGSLDTGDEKGVGRDPGSVASTPRWVKVFGIVTLIVVVLFVVLLLTGGHHNPGRHMGGGDGAHAALARIAGYEKQQS
jgi:hypothetical protein